MNDDRPAPDLIPLLYSESDLDKLGVLSRKTRYRLRKSKKFPATRVIGTRRLYLASEIHAYLERCPTSELDDLAKILDGKKRVKTKL